MTAPNAAAASRTAVLLVNLGTPDAPTAKAVRRYLAEFLHDHRVVNLTRWLWCPLLHGAILPLRSPRVARKYASVWMAGRGSPLRVHTMELADAVQARLPDLRVAAAMRYGQPGIAATLRALQADGVHRVLVLPLYPQYSSSTTASVLDAVARAFAQAADVPGLRFVRDYHADAGWLDALAAHIARQRADAPGDLLLFSFHGIPERFVRAGDTYARECEATATALAQRLGLATSQWKLSYQSRFGREAWLGPATVDVLRDSARNGVARVDVACPGFAVDCLETLEEIAMQEAERFVQAGGTALRYLPALNAEPAHADALAAIARRHAQGWD